jgi:hypothetical protein
MMRGENWTPHAAGDELFGLHIGRDPGAPPEKRRLEGEACRLEKVRKREEAEAPSS